MDFPSGHADDLAELIRCYPLAWMITCGSAGFDAVPLPLVAELDEGGEVTALIGHCSRRNSQVAALRDNPRAWALFMGPQGYVSPSLVSRPQWVPTWNYGVAVLTVDVELQDETTPDAVRLLVDTAEKDFNQPWTMQDGGERIPALMQRIIGFRAAVVARDVRLKLGQEEDVPTVSEIIAGLGTGDLAQWMLRLNTGRLAQPAIIGTAD